MPEMPGFANSLKITTGRGRNRLEPRQSIQVGCELPLFADVPSPIRSNGLTPVNDTTRAARAARVGGRGYLGRLGLALAAQSNVCQRRSLFPVGRDRPALILALVMPVGQLLIAEPPRERGRPAVDAGGEVDLAGILIHEADAQPT